MPHPQLRMIPICRPYHDCASVAVFAGSRASDEVVLLYVIPSHCPHHSRRPTHTLPQRLLKGFRRVRLEPSASRHVEMRVMPADLQLHGIKGRLSCRHAWTDSVTMVHFVLRQVRLRAACCRTVCANPFLRTAVRACRCFHAVLLVCTDRGPVLCTTDEAEPCCSDIRRFKLSAAGNMQHCRDLH